MPRRWTDHNSFFIYAHLATTQRRGIVSTGRITENHFVLGRDASVTAFILFKNPMETVRLPSGS
jgi:hypothetical protein